MKNIILIPVISLGLFLLPVTEADIQAFDSLEIGVYGESIFTTFAFPAEVFEGEDFEDEDFEIAADLPFGFKFGGEANFEPGIYGAVEFASLNASATFEDRFTEKIAVTMNGFRGNAGINIIEIANLGNEFPDVIFKGGAGYYTGEMETTFNSLDFTFDLENSLGFLFGGEVRYEVIQNLNIRGGAAYRVLETAPALAENLPGEPENLNFGGLELSAGASFEF